MIITLTTDFGTRDPWVGIMKGVILGICPDARLVDLTHEIAPQDVLEAALALESAARHFPPGTAHLAVVDPGVGSPRRALALSADGQFFVGPDNGLFTFALERAGRDFTAVSLEAPAYRLAPVSRTFHGRDLFAPAVAHIAAGVALARLGPPLEDPVRLPLSRAQRRGDMIEGEVIATDHFGNLLTSVTGEDVAALGGPWALEVAGRPVGGLASSYAEGPPGKPVAIIGSTGRVEIFVRDASAAAALGTSRGTVVKVRRI
jgi:S-adenosyl-L-methionine hydrolase (adenosine-forming)